MNDMTPIKPELADVTAVGNRQALLLPEGFPTLEGEQWVVERERHGLTFYRYVAEHWEVVNRMVGSYDEDAAAAALSIRQEQREALRRGE